MLLVILESVNKNFHNDAVKDLDFLYLDGVIYQDGVPHNVLLKSIITLALEKKIWICRI